jgi:hypothetical protein
MEEKEFRKVSKIEKAEDEVIRQDMDKAIELVEQEFIKYFGYAFGSMVLTLPGEYSRQNLRRQESYDYYEEGLAKDTGGGDSYEIPKPVQHYEFDGFSIDVYGVTSGPSLGRYLEEKGLTTSQLMQLDKYINQYVAVIESKTKPPIDEKYFSLLKRHAPDTLEYLIDELESDPEKNDKEIARLKGRLRSELYSEYRDYYELELDEYVFDLVDAVFGKTNFDGEVLNILLPLDEGKMFFPLGTSGGWENKIGDIDILFKVPEDTALSLPSSKHAYFENSHWYLIQMQNANPDFDLESELESTDSSEKDEMERAGFIYDNRTNIGLLIVIISLFLFWFMIACLCQAYIIKNYKNKFNKKGEGAPEEIKKRTSKSKHPERKMEKNEKNKLSEKTVLKNPFFWLAMGLSLIISLPGMLLILLLKDPVKLNKVPNNLMPLTLIIMYPFSIIMFLVGVMI